MGEIFIMDISYRIKFQPSITNMHGKDRVPGDIHKIQDPRKSCTSDLPLYPEMLWRSQVEPTVSSIGKEGRTVCEKEEEKIFMCFS